MSKGTSYKDGFKLWLDNLYEGKDTSTFGIVKTDKPPSFMDGAMTYTSYQFLNTIPIAYEDMERFLCPSIDFLQKIQEDSMFLRYKINYLRETDLEDLRVLNADNYRRKTVMDMLFKTPDFERTEFYSNLREDVCKYFKKRLKRGEVMVSGNYEVLFGNPYEYLVATINKAYQPAEPLLLSDGEVYTCRFKDGEELLGVRSPHITMGNLYVVRNKHCKEIDEYFDLTNEIVCVNAIKSNIQHIAYMLSNSMVRSVHMLLHEALDGAVKERIIPSNPTKGVVLPKIDYKDKRILLEYEIDRLLEVAKEHEGWYDFFYLECMTGLRKGEICALKWSDYDEVC